MAHYIGMSGLRGCLPDQCASYDTIKDAAESISQLFDLGRGDVRRLVNTGWLDLDIHKGGAEYAEIIGCECAHPEDHNDLASWYS